MSIVLFSGCKLTKLVPKDKYLLESNKIKIVNSNEKFPDLAKNIRHKPNRKILGLFKFHLGVYRMGYSLKHPEKNVSHNRKDDVKHKYLLRKYLREKIGEPPAILDTIDVSHSANNLRNYLFNNGYYNANVIYTIKYNEHKRKGYVTYIVDPGQVYKTSAIALSADDADIDMLLNDTLNNTLIREGKGLTVEGIDEERARLALVLRNKGYFDFTKEYIDFELDTIIATKTVKVLITVANRNDTLRFEQKRINRVTVFFDNDEETKRDQKVQLHKNTYFYFNGFPVKPEIIWRNIAIKPDSLFTQTDLEATYTRLSDVSIVKFVDIQFTPAEGDTLNRLNVIIKVRTGFRQSYSIEPQALLSQVNRITNTFGSSTSTYGVANALVYTHKNLFRNTEQFNLTATTRAEFQAFIDTSKKLTLLKYAAFKQSISASLLLPKTRFLKVLEKNKSIISIKTNINLNYQYEYNIDFTRKILSSSYIYQIQYRKTLYYFDLLDVSFSRNNLAANLFDRLKGRSDSAFVALLFADNLITSTSLKFIYSNKATVKGKSYWYIKANALEVGGIVHRGIRRALDTEKSSSEDTSYKLLDVNYYEYVKSEIDIRLNTIINARTSSVFRINAGFGFPFGNQHSLPFDKLFFIGGSNSLRAWRPRTIGPGAYSDPTKSFRVDRSGDIIIQGNAELRFDLIGHGLEGAVFVDAGNIWNLRTKKVIRATDEIFDFRTFIPELAVNTGVGLRFDFQFFMIRLDWGIQVRNPEKSAGERYVIKDIRTKGWLNNYSIVNLGVGYPF
ncbi:MAG: BamA/TamA family outer membrane protein [Bacteroidia bacterium]|nr:BamA/TamA family outer membrane protein [Bacteroidia bacterium]